MKNVTSTNVVLDFKDFLKYSDTLIETGTCHGTSTKKALDAGFKTVKSVEAWAPFFEHSVKLLRGYDNCHLFFGESSERLPDMLRDVVQPVVFFLDAHPAGPNTAGHDDFMQKQKKSDYDQSNILMRELKAIFKHGNDHVIIIDDQNGDDANNHADIKTLMDFCTLCNPTYEFFFYDEEIGGLYTKNKSLICIPRV